MEGYFPDSLKITEIIPIFKEGDNNKCNNYRPISLLPTIAKLFEKQIKKRLINFISSTTKIDPNQFGFQAKSSTDAALCNVLHSSNKYIDIGHYVVVLFVDLRKAFDMVDHNILLNILEELEVRGSSLNLFESYLKNRKVATRVNGVKSEDNYLQTGVPQGSVLGPTLYLLYINSLRYLNTFGEQTIYADDTCFLYHSKNVDEIIYQINQDMKQYFNWLDGQKLVINLKKSNFMVFKPKGKTQITFNLGENLQKIERVSKVKYLGVILDMLITFSKKFIQ